MTVGYAAVSWLAGATACVPILGWGPWWDHQARQARTLAGFAIGTGLAAHVPLGIAGRWPDLAARCLILAAWLLPTLGLWAHRHGWGGLGERGLPGP